MKLPELQPMNAGTGNLYSFSGIKENVNIPERYVMDSKKTSS